MEVELILLGWSIVLGMIHMGAAALAKRAQEPRHWGLGNRDTGEPRYSGLAARLIRAQGNFMETFPFFAGAVLVTHLLGKEGTTSAWGAGLYMAGRVTFLPLYAFGIPYVRTVAWLMGTLGLLMVLFHGLLT